MEFTVQVKKSLLTQGLRFTALIYLDFFCSRYSVQKHGQFRCAKDALIELVVVYEVTKCRACCCFIFGKQFYLSEGIAHQKNIQENNLLVLFRKN